MNVRVEVPAILVLIASTVLGAMCVDASLDFLEMESLVLVQ